VLGWLAAFQVLDAAVETWPWFGVLVVAVLLAGAELGHTGEFRRFARFVSVESWYDAARGGC